MKRSKSQLLFNFLPESTFDHGSNSTIGKVTHMYEDRESRVSDLPIKYMLNRIVADVEQWPNDVPLRARTVNVVSPDGVEYELFPRAFECSRCGAYTEISSARINQGRPAYCGNCEKRLSDIDQAEFVLVCHCGRMETMPVPECGSCGDEHPRFIQETSRLRDANWICSECGEFIGKAFDHIYPCTCGKNRVIKPYSASSTFYPQTATFVNIDINVDDRDLGELMRDSNFQSNTIVNYLVGKASPASEEGSSNITLPDGASIPEFIDVEPADIPDADEGIRQALDAAMEFDIEELTAHIEDQLRTTEDGKAGTESGIVEKIRTPDTVREEIVDPMSDRRRRELSEEIFEYRSLIGETDTDIEMRALEDLPDLADSRPDLDTDQTEEYLELRDDLNLDRLRLIEDFPVTTLVYGYSRLAPTPGGEDETELNLFEDRDGNDRMFAITSQTESVLLTLDPERVAEWLLRNDVITDRPSEGLEAWFLKTLESYPSYAEIDPSDATTTEEQQALTVARHVQTLLHTYSHLFINSVDALAGYSKRNLVEYMFPRLLSVAIYRQSTTDFSLGAMHTLVEQRFDEVYEYIQGDTDVCMYDPVCEREENAACEGCLYISNLSCANGNHNLNRSTVHGGIFEGEEISGYLEL